MDARGGRQKDLPHLSRPVPARHPSPRGRRSRPVPFEPRSGAVPHRPRCLQLPGRSWIRIARLQTHRTMPHLSSSATVTTQFFTIGRGTTTSCCSRCNGTGESSSCTTSLLWKPSLTHSLLRINDSCLSQPSSSTGAWRLYGGGVEGFSCGLCN